MSRTRSRVVETEMVNPRILGKRAVKRQHIDRWAVGKDELAPGIVGDRHIHPSLETMIREVASGSGVGQLLLVSATAQSFASGGAYVTADSITFQHGFDDVTAAGDSIVWPVTADGSIQVEFSWATYEGGGTVEIEVDGTVPAWGTLGAGSSGSEGCKRRGAHIAEGSVVKVKVTQTSGSAQTADVLVEFLISDPSVGVDPAPNYELVVMGDEPIAYWRLDESSGTSAVDLANSHTGTYTGPPTLAAAGLMDDGNPNTSVDLDGVNDFVDAGNLSAAEFAGTAPFTLEAWVRPDTIPGSDSDEIVSKCWADGSFTRGWTMVVNSSSQFGLVRGNASGQDNIAMSGAVAGTTHHVVFTYDGATVIGYLNGVAAISAASARSIPSNTWRLLIGAKDDLGATVATHHFDGRIDEVAIWGRALTADEVAEHYTVGTSG